MIELPCAGADRLLHRMYPVQNFHSVSLPLRQDAVVWEFGYTIQ
jgi:hypothetical protein